MIRTNYKMTSEIKIFEMVEIFKKVNKISNSIFLKVIEIRYDAQSAFIVNSLGKIKNLWMIVFFETLMFNVLIIFC